MGVDEDGVNDDNIHGDTYYFSLISFLKYENEFKSITEGSIPANVHRVNCEDVSKTHFSSNVFSDPCNKVAKYLYFIKEKQEEDYDNRCRYLNYLLNTKSEFKTFSNKKCSEMFAAYKAISSELETCNLNIGCISEEDLRKIKKLHNLHNSFSKLEEFIEQNNWQIDSTAEEFAELYRNATIACQPDNSEDYCVALKEFEILCDHHVKSKNCSEIAELMKYQRKINKAFKIVVPCIMILCISFFLYILHKFTSFGSWLNAFLIKNKIIPHNMNEEVTDQLFNYIYENEDRDNTCSSHHIGYHST
ncbi:PIR Superfamily Protein [Plasmodium ovale wallikeri]|uniref:PIR Superfamily Protein n=1 Tax=Plasmodium ovale wallikeri TaxID=864142 RepID=A0A1A9AGD9_PLAOA|nr:PIR Superfamily Protein [Plasmodium ovale wallikeri]